MTIITMMTTMKTINETKNSLATDTTTVRHAMERENVRYAVEMEYGEIL